jgi:metal-dependent amidase/aminoacylase/carboxypeptidase family protein
VAEASGARIEVDFTSGPPPVLNDSRLVGLLQEVGMDLLGPRGVDWIPRPSMGGEDFAFYLEHVPGAMFRLGCSLPGVTGHSLHTAHFDLDEQSLVVGAKVLARAAVLRCDPERDPGGDADG